MKVKLDTQGEERKHVNKIIMAVLPCCKPKLGEFTSLYDQASTPLVFPRLHLPGIKLGAFDLNRDPLFL